MHHSDRVRRSWCPLLALILTLAASPIEAQSPRAAPPPTPAINRDWRVLRTAAFTVVSEGGDSQAREVARHIEGFRDAVRVVFPSARLDPLVPTYVVVFDSQDSFGPFRPMRNGRRERWVGGYFASEDHANYMVLGRDGAISGTMSLVFHEYMHYVMQRTFASVPHWYNEGVADFFSGLSGTSWDSRGYIGRPLPYRVEALLTRGGPLPVREMLADVPAARWQRDNPTRFYATAWIMTHYFLMDPARHKGLLALFAALAAGTPADAAVPSALGMSIEKLDQELGNYYRRPSLPVIALAPKADTVADVPVERIGEADLARLQAELLIAVSDLKGADALVRKATAAAAGHDGLRTVAARVALSQDRPADALVLLADAAAPRTADSLQAEARALRATGRLDDAAARLASAAALGAPSPALHYEIGYVHMARASWPDATLAFTRLRQIDPRPDWDLRRAYDALTLGYGVYAAGAARSYIGKVGWASPSSPYAAFAGLLGLQRDGKDADAARLLAEVAAATAGRAWPAPVVAFLQRTSTAQELLALATDARERTEAHAYIGLVASAAGRIDEAREHLTWVVTRGEDTLVEHRWAVAELKRLTAK